MLAIRSRMLQLVLKTRMAESDTLKSIRSVGFASFSEPFNVHMR